MADSTAYLEGGPCNGKTRTITPAEADAGQIYCKGALYQNPEKGLHHGPSIVFKYAGAAPSSGTGTGPNINAPQALGGWKALRKSVNKGMPGALDYSQHVTARTLRTLSRARKVRL